MSQNDKILTHLRDVGSISWVEANDLYRVRSLQDVLLTCVSVGLKSTASGKLTVLVNATPVIP